MAVCLLWLAKSPVYGRQSGVMPGQKGIAKKGMGNNGFYLDFYHTYNIKNMDTVNNIQNIFGGLRNCFVYKFNGVFYQG